MNLRSGLVLLMILACAGMLCAEPSTEMRETTDRLASSVYTGPAMGTLRELSDEFGGRVTGTPAYNSAAQWAASKFRSYGIQNVRLEPFTIPNGWVRGSAHGELLTPKARALHLESLGWSPSTPAGGIKGEVAIVDDVSPEHLKELSPKLKGKIVFYDISKIFADGWTKVLPLLQDSYAVVKNAGAVGIVFPDHDRNNVLNATDPNHFIVIGHHLAPALVAHRSAYRSPR